MACLPLPLDWFTDSCRWFTRAVPCCCCRSDRDVQECDVRHPESGARGDRVRGAEGEAKRRHRQTHECSAVQCSAVQPAWHSPTLLVPRPQSRCAHTLMQAIPEANAPTMTLSHTPTPRHTHAHNHAQTLTHMLHACIEPAKMKPCSQLLLLHPKAVCSFPVHTLLRLPPFPRSLYPL